MVDRNREDTEDRSRPREPWCSSPPASTQRTKIDELLTLLSHRRRRNVLYYLSEHDLASLDTLATTIAARELGIPSEGVPNADRQAVLVDLYHNHLPKLADRGLIEYDDRSGAIRWTAPSTDLETLLECTRSLESDDE